VVSCGIGSFVSGSYRECKVVIRCRAAFHFARELIARGEETAYFAERTPTLGGAVSRNECGMPGTGTPADERGGVIFQCKPMRDFCLPFVRRLTVERTKLAVGCGAWSFVSGSLPGMQSCESMPSRLSYARELIATGEETAHFAKRMWYAGIRHPRG
jgi:hypothetical protein